MSSIVAGRFDAVSEAEAVARTLYQGGFSVWDVCILSVGGGGRPDGTLLAVRVDDAHRAGAADTLREAGAADIEQAEGRWEYGQWTDFDPQAAPVPLDEGAEQGEPWPRPLAREAVAPESTGNEDPGSELEHYVEKQVSRRR